MQPQVMTVKDLNRRILNREEVFMLDVRNKTDFQRWKIEGFRVDHLNVPYFELIDDVEPLLPQLPRDKEIVVVCAKEGSSYMIAVELAKKGFRVSYLAGGMKGWSEHLAPVLVHQDEHMKVIQFVRVGKGCLSYMILSDGEALVVDPVRFTDTFLEFAKQESVRITHIVDSHLHADHISGGRELAKKTGAKYYLMKSEGATFDFHPLEEHHEIDFARVHLEVLAVKTPGHTPGSVSFFVNGKLLFSGDTLFVSGLGRPDLGGKVREWAEDLYDTVYEKVSNIADEVLVLPAHYADYREIDDNGLISATLGQIRQNNRVMQGMEKEEFVEKVAASSSTETPPNFEEIISINRGTINVDSNRKQELEIGPNRCAAHHTR